MIRFEKRGLMIKENTSFKPVYHFYKKENQWFIDLPKYVLNGGEDADLEMVDGADELLNLMASGKRKVSIQMDVVYFDGADTLELEKICEAPKGGGYYRLLTFRSSPFNKKIWLCDVTLFVFGDLPEKIYIKPVPYTSI